MPKQPKEAPSDHGEAVYQFLGAAAYLMLPDPADRIPQLGALLEDAIRQLPKRERNTVTQYVINQLLKQFPPPKSTPKGAAGLTPEPPLH
jgi:hypothetical protein